MNYAWLFLSMLGLTAGLMPLLIRLLQTRNWLAVPNERSSHALPTPLGGGWLALGLPLLCLPFAALMLPDAWRLSLYVLAVAGLALLVVSGINDKIGLKPLWRLTLHLAAAATAVWSLPETVRVFPLLPELAETVILTLGLVWFVNLTNFIDGIDGITAVNGLSSLLGFALLFALAGAALFLPLSAALLGGALLGFLLWNWHPARVFLGDVGSVPLGLWLGTGLIVAAAGFGLPAALLLCLYPLCDASWTLLRRLKNREKIWQAHKTHFYQQAVQNGRTHSRTSVEIALFNLACVMLALAAVLQPDWQWVWLGIGIAGFVLLARHFKTARR